MIDPHPDWLTTLARQLAADSGLEAVWGRVVQASVTQVEGAQHAGITVLSGRSGSTNFASDALVLAVDQQQYATGEGPCLSAARDEPVVLTQDLRLDDRWPKFREAVAHLPVRAILSFRLYTDIDTIGALNLYADIPQAFTEESVQTGTMLAAHAAVAAAAEARSDNLRIALQSRDTIGQAKGILMERHKITSDQAFDLLIAASQKTNRKLNDVAAALVTTGELRNGAPGR